MTKIESKKSLSRNSLPRVACVMIVFLQHFTIFTLKNGLMSLQKSCCVIHMSVKKLILTSNIEARYQAEHNIYNFKLMCVIKILN